MFSLPRPLVLLLSVIAAVALSLGWLAAAPAAHAHDELLSSSPADGESLDAAPSEATFTFSGEIAPVGVVFALTDADGATLSLPTVPKVAGTEVTQQLPPLEGGQYELGWRVVSSDGHPISGTVTFTVAGSASTGSADPSEPAASESGEASAVPAANEAQSPEPSGDAVNQPAAAADGMPIWAIVLIGIAGLAGLAVIVGAILGFRASAKRNEELRQRAEGKGNDIIHPDA